MKMFTFTLGLKFLKINPIYIYYIIIIFINIIYNIEISSLILLDGESIHELDGRPIIQENNVHQIPQYQNRQYIPYHPGDILTGQGYRYELDSQNIHEMGNTKMEGSSRIPRIPNPSHYPQDQFYQQLENNPQYSEDSYTQINDILPTRSEVAKDGIYFGTNIHPKLKKSIPKHSFLKDLKTRIVTNTKNLEKRHEVSVKKHIDKQTNWQKTYEKAKAIEIKNTIYSENSFRDGRILTRAEVSRLIKKGYMIKKGKIVKIPKK